MSLTAFVENVVKDLNEHGFQTVEFTAEEFVHGVLSRVGFWYNYGDDFYEHDWDLLILLDACRWDLMEEVADEYGFVEDYDSYISPASHSREWMHKTFKECEATGLDRARMWARVLHNPDDDGVFEEYYRTKDMSDTAYVSWNVFSRMLDPDRFQACHRLGLQEWNQQGKILPPREITDRTIQVMREQNPERTIAHYMQPHSPFEGLAAAKQHDGSVWDLVQRGVVTREKAWEHYRENLRWVLDDVELLLENADAESVVISADHGNAIGEWGCYGHRPYTPIDGVKKVPWVETTASDDQTHEPKVTDEEVEIDRNAVMSRLEDLGYA